MKLLIKVGQYMSVP